MPKYLLDLWLDGYEDEEDEKKACDEFISDQLDITASSVHFENLIEDGEEGPSVEQLAKIWNTCKKFKDKYKPSCPESIHQVDEINLACTEFVEELFHHVGYCGGEEEGESEE